ncbi:MAG: hypothetical protein HY700_18715 [Gemmatimonadetes bacterium]|nr:hypothetical protein [Gemmatimonadota bacterium]
MTLLPATGCESGALRFPTAVGGGTGGGTPGQVITGTWRRTLVVQTQTDVITSETTWLFATGGACERTVVTNSVLQGFPETQRSPCSYTVAGSTATIHFDGTSGTVSFSVFVSGNKLFLGGVEFVRIG